MPVASIETVPVAEATGMLRAEYDAAIARSGRVWQIVGIESFNAQVTPETKPNPETEGAKDAFDKFFGRVKGDAPHAAETKVQPNGQSRAAHFAVAKYPALTRYLPGGQERLSRRTFRSNVVIAVGSPAERVGEARRVRT
jgi:hypothetical protein